MNSDYFNDPRPDVQMLLPAGARRVLDIGCASGALGAALKEKGVPHVSGIEQNPDAARAARARIDRVVEGDLSNIDPPFQAEEFDCIIFADVLEHIPDPECALSRYLHFLAPQGAVIISVPNMRFYAVLLRLIFDRWSYSDSGVRDRTHLRIFTRRSLQEMLARVGLRTEQVHRNYRLVEDQSRIGRFGACATQLIRNIVAPVLFRNLMAFQYVVRARRPLKRAEV